MAGSGPSSVDGILKSFLSSNWGTYLCHQSMD